MNKTKDIILYVYEASKIKLCWDKTHNHPNNWNLDKTMIKDVLQDEKRLTNWLETAHWINGVSNTEYSYLCLYHVIMKVCHIWVYPLDVTGVIVLLED